MGDVRRGHSGVLVVCTTNVCRSPAAASLLVDALGPGVNVHSAGVQAVAGAPACEEGRAWWESEYGSRRGRHRRPDPVHSARPLEPDMIRSSTLVLTATRDHWAAVVGLVPAAQAYTFTLVQAARIAAWRPRVSEEVTEEGAASSGATGATRLASLVRALDAGRGRAPLSEQESRDDIPDPHIPDPHKSPALHPLAMRAIHEAVVALAALAAQTGPRMVAPAI